MVTSPSSHFLILGQQNVKLAFVRSNKRWESCCFKVLNIMSLKVKLIIKYRLFQFLSNYCCLLIMKKLGKKFFYTDSIVSLQIHLNNHAWEQIHSNDCNLLFCEMAITYNFFDIKKILSYNILPLYRIINLMPKFCAIIAFSAIKSI